MKEIEGGVTAPKGYRAAGVAARIKGVSSGKKDCALIVSDTPASVAGAFTTNRFKAPPVERTEHICERGGPVRAVFLNSGNANACTGPQGVRDAQTTAETVAQALGLSAAEVCVTSTGVIGVPLPMDRIAQGVRACAAALSEEGSHDAALAIMTTDTVPKEMAIEAPLGDGAIRIGAIAKGAGMIAPDMATMICIITTDARIAAEHLQPLLRECVGASFNCICIDNDMSTSDTVLCLANGAAGLPEIAPGTHAFQALAQALRYVCVAMAQALVRDGEGATKFVEIQVEGAGTDEDAKTIARSIAMSQLCKTAFFGQDPNWGRIACAAGYAGVAFEPSEFRIWLDDLQIVEAGMPASYGEEAAAAVMRQPEFRIRVSVGAGGGSCVFWTSDLSHEYVTINADYRT